jgi:hypothetical protein
MAVAAMAVKKQRKNAELKQIQQIQVKPVGDFAVMSLE